MVLGSGVPSSYPASSSSAPSTSHRSFDPHEGPFDPNLPDPRVPNAASILRRAGYDAETIDGMIVHSKRRRKDSEVKTNMREWTQYGLNMPEKMAERKRKYTRKGRENREAWNRLQRQGGSVRLGSSDGVNGRNGASARERANAPSGGGTIVLPKEAMEQIWNEIRHSEKIKPADKQATFDEINQAIKAQDVEALQRRLKRLKIHTADPRIGGKVYNELGEAEVRRRFERLARSETNGGMGIPRDVADVMMRDMLGQSSKKAADTLYESWSRVKRMSPGREKATALREIVKRYEGGVVEAADSKSKNLIMPWTVGLKDR